MSSTQRPLRLLLIAVLAAVLVALLWLLLGALRSAVGLWQALRDLPAWAQSTAVIAIAALILGFAFVAWRILHPRPRKPVVVAAPKRSEVVQRLDTLAQQRVDTEALQAELVELDRRAQDSELYVALFGEISSGKSSLIAAIADAARGRSAPTDSSLPQADVLGGTTTAVAHYRASLGSDELANARELILADVPGSHEVAGLARETIARDEALRAHIVLYVCASDLTRDQDAELRWLRGFGKPLVLVLNKADQFRAGERETLQRMLGERYRALTDAQVVVSAGGTETFERRLADGRSERVVRDRLPAIGALLKLLDHYAAHGAGALEPAREAAVLTAINARADSLALAARETNADAIVTKYTRRAVVGALAAVMPGSDLVIQAVLATALIRELSKLYEVPVRDIDIDGFLGQVKLTLRTSTSLVLAIAGNAAKAFPGLGTLGGGLLHAIAYGLIFDSLGRAVAITLRDRHALDSDAAASALKTLLADSSADRLRRIAEFALRSDKENHGE
jgi:GTP-binding protein EngB required for normal cell division